MAETELSFEEKLAGVQRIIAGIEGGKLPLEESVRQYEEGIRTLNALENELKEMSRRLTVLQQDADGGSRELPMEEPS